MAERPRAELPRVLNVQQFTAAREPELRGLWESLKVLDRLDGSKLLPRHLRRRATSHRRYICRRRPNSNYLPAKLQQQQQLQQEEEDAAAAVQAEGDTAVEDADQPPAAAAAAAAAAACKRPLNRRQRRRGALLQQQLVAEGCCQDLAAIDSDTAAVRRRLETHIWHARRMRMCTRFGHILAVGAVGRGRGSRSFLQQVLSNAPQPKPDSRHHKTPAATAASSSSSSSSTMAAAVRPRPVRAGCHDASYWCCLQLQGQQQQLISLLLMITDPDQLQDQILSDPTFMMGQREVGLVMYEPKKFPLGAVGPVKLMWHWQRQRQQQQQQQQHLPEQQIQPRGVQQQEQQPHRVVIQEQQQQGQQPSRRALKRQQHEQQRQQQSCTLWMWCHASYFKQVHDVLQDLIQQQQDIPVAVAAGYQQAGVPPVTQHAAAAAIARSSSSSTCKDVSLRGVTVTSLCSSLRRLEIVGPDADYIIKSAFQQQQQHIQSTTANPNVNTKQQPKSKAHNPVWQDLNRIPLSSWAHLPQGCVLGFSALDPRLAKPLKHPGMFAAAAAGSSDRPAEDITAAAAGSKENLKSLKSLISGWRANGRLWVSGGQQLLLNPSSIPPAAPEVLVSMWRHQQQQAALGLTPAWQHSQQGGVAGAYPAAICHVERSKISPYGITSYITAASSSSSSSSSSDNSSPLTAQLPQSCPVLLIRASLQAAAAAAAGTAAGSSPGWSVVLPAGWVMPFWTAITQAGAKPAGLREWSWMAAATQRPLPPLDYPDTAAAAAAARQQQQEGSAAAARRPLGRLDLQDCWLPFLNWSRIGQQLWSGENAAAAADGSSEVARQLPHVSVCWAAARELQAAAVAAKRRQRKHRQMLRKQERFRQQKQQQQQQQQQVGEPQQHKVQQQKQQHEAVQSIARPQQQQQQQKQKQLEPFLPPDWYVARSWKVLLAALPAAAIASSSTAAAAPAVPPVIVAGGQYRSRVLLRAVQKGTLAWAPRPRTKSLSGTTQTERYWDHSPTGPAAAAAAAGSSEAAAGPVVGTNTTSALAAEAATAHERDQMDVDDQVVLAASSDGQVAAAHGRAAPKTPQQQQQQQQQQLGQCLVRVAVRVIGKGRCQQGALLLSSSHTTCSTNSSDPTSPSSSSSSSGIVTLLGYLTTAMPRGAPASLYPGGLGFCCVRELWGSRCCDVTANSSRVLRAWCLNPGSNVLRKVELTVLLQNDRHIR